MMHATSFVETMTVLRPAGSTPTVSIGLPVYNGSRYLRQAVDSILAQTFQDFELVISDNASSDDTQAICETYAAQNPRVRYYRAPQNRGVTWNFRRVALHSSGELFMWVAHDDILAPEYVERCLEVLQKHPESVLCYSAAADIDEEGTPVPHHEFGARVDAASAHIRFRDLMRMEHLCEPIFGLMRSAILKKTPIHGDFPDSDRCVLAELALYGPFYRIPEPLFFRREHSGRVTLQTPSRQDRLAIIRPGRQTRFVFPHFRQFWEYVAAVHRAPLKAGERARCYLEILRWIRNNSHRLLRDLRYVVNQAIRPRHTEHNSR
jgi:glycosyltransferase involved in cell wall biosynthesis